MSELAKTSARVHAEATAWRARLAEAEVETTAPFEDWLAADPANRVAWERVDGVWSLFGEHATAPRLIAARHVALADVRRFGRLGWYRPLRAYAIGTVAAGAVACGILFFLFQPADYVTNLGERRTITLSDNSEIVLDSGSEVEVRYTRGARELWLLKGQARFQVAHDKRRPFRVHADGETVTATGTNFDVDSGGQGIVVTLIEGRIVAAGAHHKIALTAGEQLTVLANGTANVGKVDTDAVTAWENGRLVFDDMPLELVAARVGRYAATPIVVLDDKARKLRVNGVFKTGDIAGFVQTVTQYLPVAASTGPEGEIRLRSRS